MPNIPIEIPEDSDDTKYDVTLKDTVTFTFTQNVEKFKTTHPATFDPPLPEGGFPSGSVIGPYTPKKKDKVHFSYDGSGSKPKAGMHTISIGD